MLTTHILKDRTSGLFFHDLSDFSTGIALTKVKLEAMEFSEQNAHTAAKTLRQEFETFEFIPVERA